MIEGEIYMHQVESAPNEAVRVEVMKPEQFKNGFGYGEGAISYETRAAVVGKEILEAVETAIESDEILLPVSQDKNGQRIEDDGCGDGRNVRRVFMGLSEKTKSLVRAKVFGGGVTMLSAMEIGAGKAAGYSLNELFRQGIAIMRRQQIDFGAHTDIHATGENSGCGAIDKAPYVIAGVVSFEEQIRGTLANMGVDMTGIDDVMRNFAVYAESIQDKAYSAKKVIDDVVREGKVVKELEDNHYEMFVLLNLTEGYTVNQELIRQVSNGKVQVFGVDVWRLQALAMKRHPNDAPAQNKALLSELVYTLGVSAALTRGDLPVRILQAQKTPVMV